MARTLHVSIFSEHDADVSVAGNNEYSISEGVDIPRARWPGT